MTQPHITTRLSREIGAGLSELRSVAGPASPRALPIAAEQQVRLSTALIACDLIAIVATMFAAGVFSTGVTWAMLLAGVGAATVLQNAGRAFGLYDLRTASRLRGGIVTLLWLGPLAVVITLLAVFGTAGRAEAAALAPIVMAPVLAVTLLRFALAAWLDRHAAAFAEQLLLVGTSDAVAGLLAASRSAGDPRRSIGIIALDDDPQTLSPPETTPPSPQMPLATFDTSRVDNAALVEDLRHIDEALRGRTRQIDRVLIAAADLDEQRLAATLQRLEHLPFEIALVPAAARFGESEDPLDPAGCLVVRRPAMTVGGAVCKRALDIVAAAILLIVLAPVFLVIAALIRRGSPGPALFRQTRWGWANEPFTVYKFRTMWSNAAATDGSVQATQGDKRITPIGAFLRSTSLDELPQLLNVLNGSMSLVGPRPHPVELNRRYLGVIDHYAGRHRVMPGITGLAQIKGFRGETRSYSAMQKRIEFDLEYIRTRSLGADIWILLRTVGSVIRGENAY